jgi:hypothetical protein
MQCMSSRMPRPEASDGRRGEGLVVMRTVLCRVYSDDDEERGIPAVDNLVV